MTAKRPLFLEGHRIVDADGVTVQELTAEQRTLVLRLARHRALSRSLVDPADDEVLGPILAVARQKAEGVSPEERRYSQVVVEEYLARMQPRLRDAIWRHGGSMAHFDAMLEAQLPDSPTDRFPLTD